MHRRSGWRVALFSLVIGSLVAGCAGQPQSGGQAPGGAPAAQQQPAEQPSGGGAQPQPVTLTWAAGSVGGGWYTQAGGLADVIHQKVPWINIRVVPGGGVQNVLAVDSGQEAELAWGLPPLVDAAMKGQDPYNAPVKNVRAILAGMGINHFHMIAGADTDIRSFEDIFGGKKPLKIALPTVGSSDEWVFRRIMAFYNTSYEDLQKKGYKFFNVSYQEQSNAYRDRNADVWFTQLALPAAAVQEGTQGRKGRLIPFPQDLVQHLQGMALLSEKIPAGTYKNVDNTEDVPVVGMGNVILVNVNVPDDVVYAITKALNEDGLQEAKAVQPQFASYDPSVGPQGTGAPLHPGAERWYKEKGLLK